MTITLNGQTVETESPGEIGLYEFLVGRGMKTDRIAVERNGVIVPRSSWKDVVIGDGDRLEVVHFVGGGCPVSV